MNTFKEISEWARVVTPLFAAVLAALNAYEARSIRWRLIAGIVSTLVLVAIGCFSVYSRLNGS